MKNVKAQSMTELAVFGALLIVGLSYLIRYGIQYNEQQRLKMETFRQAMNESYSKNQGGDSPAMVTVKDFSLPEPGDRFGLGSRTTLQSTANVIWSNELYNSSGTGESPATPADQAAQLNAAGVPSLSYVFNPQTGIPQRRDYTTAKYEPVDMNGKSITIFLADNMTKNIPPGEYTIASGNLGKDYHTEMDMAGTSKKVVKGLFRTGDCTTSYCPYEFITSGDVDQDGKAEQIVTPTDPDEDGLLSGIISLDAQNGDIDTEKMSIDSDNGITAENLQGLLPGTNSETLKKQSLRVVDSAASTAGVSVYDNKDRIQYRIRTQDGSHVPVENSVTFDYTRKGTEQWTAPK